jgi:hypothetical protein
VRDRDQVSAWDLVVPRGPGNVVAMCTRPGSNSMF